MSMIFDLFEKVMFEAPEDEPPPDIGGIDETPDTTPPIDDPPDLSSEPDDTPTETTEEDTPPELGGEEEIEDYGDESFEDDPEANINNLGLDDKISAIMNMNLYQRYLTLLNNIGNQLSMLKNNNDILYTLSSDSLDIIGSLKKLDENIRLYLMNYFLDENYSSNLLFFNKCINLVKLLNEVFDNKINKGIKGLE